MEYNDPFSIVYKSIWDCAESSEHVTSLVKLRNRIRLDQANQFPTKPTVSDTDLPELALMLNGGIFKLNATSSSTHMTKNFAWMITTGQTIVNQRILPVEFALARAMKNWHTQIANATWNGKQFIHRVVLGDISEGVSDPERNRGLTGWSALITISVEMTFQTGDL